MPRRPYRCGTIRLDERELDRGSTVADVVDCWKCANLYPAAGDSNAIGTGGKRWACLRAEQLEDPPHLDDGDPSFRRCVLYVVGNPRELLR